MIALFDHGSGNLASAQRVLEHVGADVRLAQDPAVIHAAWLVAEVGMFGERLKRLRARRMVEVV